MNQEEYAHELKQHKKAFQAALSTRDGKIMLDKLVSVFQKSTLFNTDPLKMAYNTAQYELIEYIKMLGEPDE